MPYTRQFAIAVLAASLSAAALAGPEHEFHGRHGSGHGPVGADPSDAMLHHMMVASKELDLSDAQKEGIRAIFDDARAQMKAAGDAAAGNRETLHAVLTADTLDEAALEKAADGAGALLAERIVIAARAAHAMRAELTAEQLAELESLREQHMTQMREHRRPREGA